MRYLTWTVVAASVALLVAAVAFQSFWLPSLKDRLGLSAPAAEVGEDEHGIGDGHEHGHDDSHAGHDETNSIELSEQGRKNIGLKLTKVELQTFVRTMLIPGVIRDVPGKSTIEVAAPLTGVVTQIHISQGATVAPGDRLFEMRLTDEDLVQAQADLLRTAQELRVTEREIARLEAVAQGGSIARKSLLERQYERQKQQAVLASQRQALLLHGLAKDDVEGILTDGKLVSELTIFAPKPTGMADAILQVQDLRVAQGQNVQAGTTLVALSNHFTLLVEGNAFERDLPAVTRASSEGWPVSIRVESESESSRLVKDLSVLYVAAKVVPESRMVHFYVSLPNEITRDFKSDTGQRFTSWRYRPGQRVEILVPVEQWSDRIVLPLSAVAQDGVENYVFTPNGDHFDRRPVHVEYRDTESVVIVNDGSVFPGSFVAVTAAQQLQIALKNKSGGAPDPHAGHNH
jgi:multidrug efflux pump subunit AcrA (membrane-fusion protein)